MLNRSDLKIFDKYLEELAEMPSGDVRKDWKESLKIQLRKSLGDEAKDLIEGVDDPDIAVNFYMGAIVPFQFIPEKELLKHLIVKAKNRISIGTLDTFFNDFESPKKRKKESKWSKLGKGITMTAAIIAIVAFPISIFQHYFPEDDKKVIDAIKDKRHLLNDTVQTVHKPSKSEQIQH